MKFMFHVLYTFIFIIIIKCFRSRKTFFFYYFLFFVFLPSCYCYYYTCILQRKKAKDSSVSVIRLSVGQNERSEPALEHVWNIICQPDGTFLVYFCTCLTSHFILFAHEWMTHIGGSLTTRIKCMY